MLLQIRPTSALLYSVPEFRKDYKRKNLKQDIPKLPEQIIMSEMRKEIEVSDINKYSEEYNVEYQAYRRKLEVDYKVYIKPDFDKINDQQVSKIKRVATCILTAVFANYKKEVDFKKQPFITFMTLTLPSKQVHTDNYIKQLLFKYIENLKKTYGVNFFLWRAETQKNGNIHFHLLIDKYINQKNASNLWNALLEKKGGYISAYSENMQKKGFLFNKNSKNSRDKQFENYLLIKSQNFQNPLTVQVKSLNKQKSPVNYLLKYMTKSPKDSDKRRQIVGKTFGMSNNVKSLKYPTCNNYNDLIIEFYEECRQFFDKTIEVSKYCTFFIGNTYNIFKNSSPLLYNYLRFFYRKLYEHLYGSNKFFDFKTVENEFYKPIKNKKYENFRQENPNVHSENLQTSLLV